MANPFSGMLGGMMSTATCRHCGTRGCGGQCQRQALVNQYTDLYTMALMQAQANAQQQQPEVRQRAPLPQEELFCATGGIIGWRTWRVPCFGDELRSINGELWPVRKALRAICKDGEKCLGEYCACGLYAWKQAVDMATNRRTEHNVLSGEVWLWGKVVEHEKGYRAEYSYPKSFIDSGADAKRLARIYGAKLIEAK